MPSTISTMKTGNSTRISSNSVASEPGIPGKISDIGPATLYTTSAPPTAIPTTISR